MLKNSENFPHNQIAQPTQRNLSQPQAAAAEAPTQRNLSQPQAAGVGGGGGGDGGA
ncbi:hypothetical protein BOX15_Mlig001308g1 [Macrostomum lignano]|uniref:Uncharacterized protein n=1 Tax=Macrostomum lignano TaxID=282301 RepID=A0A267GN88_9PLAT|nr:hypothetical protein BOX15_Mlig001308g1 [Macrostomum lignano]